VSDKKPKPKSTQEQIVTFTLYPKLTPSIRKRYKKIVGGSTSSSDSENKSEETKQPKSSSEPSQTAHSTKSDTSTSSTPTKSEKQQNEKPEHISAEELFGGKIPSTPEEYYPSYKELSVSVGIMREKPLSPLQSIVEEYDELGVLPTKWATRLSELSDEECREAEGECVPRSTRRRIPRKRNRAKIARRGQGVLPLPLNFSNIVGNRSLKM